MLPSVPLQEPCEDDALDVDIQYVALMGGQPRWFPELLSEERLTREHEVWTEKFNKANPPVTKGTYKVELTDCVDDMADNRYPLIGGPMDGQGWAKEIKIKKGRGKNALEVTFNNAPGEIKIIQGSVIGIYLAQPDQAMNILEYRWYAETEVKEQGKFLLGDWPEDPYNDGYWEQDKNRVNDN